MTIRNIVKKIMKKRDVGPNMLAAAVGLRAADLQGWLDGKPTIVPFETVMKICEHLKIKLCAEHRVGHIWKREPLKP